ncbi:MBG domain-containing protein, partial [Treponema sp. R6D11]
TTLINDRDYTITASNNKNAGTASVLVTLKGNYSGSGTVSFTINKANLTLSTPSQSYSINYGQIIKDTLTVDYTGFVNGENLDTANSTGSICFIATKNGIDYNEQTVLNAGTYTIRAGGLDFANYNVISQNAGTLIVNKVAPSISTSPTKIQNLSYDNSSQNLITSGATTDGVLMYAASNNTTPPSIETFASSVPQATNKGTYYVFYYILGDENHLDSSISEPIEVAISPKTITPSITIEGVYTYTGEEISPLPSAVKVSDGQTTLIYGIDYTYSVSNNINAGT